MCEREKVQTLQRGMNFRLNPNYSVILMSRRSNAPYRDRVLEDGKTIIYEGHDAFNTTGVEPKNIDQPIKTPNGKLTQNGLFILAVEKYKQGESKPEQVRVYEKILDGVWSLKGTFELLDSRYENDGKRKVVLFKLKLAEDQEQQNQDEPDFEHTRLIPSEVKKAVYKRDRGVCVLCKSIENIHFDHDLPFSLGGTSLTEKNIRLLCAKCNLAKSDKIE